MVLSWAEWKDTNLVASTACYLVVLRADLTVVCSVSKLVAL